MPVSVSDELQKLPLFGSSGVEPHKPLPADSETGLDLDHSRIPPLYYLSFLEGKKFKNSQGKKKKARQRPRVNKGTRR